MSKGVTTACPNCKKVITANAKFNGRGIYELKCPYCLRRVKVEIDRITKIKATLLIIAVLIGGYLIYKNLLPTPSYLAEHWYV